MGGKLRGNVREHKQRFTIQEQFSKEDSNGIFAPLQKGQEYNTECILGNDKTYTNEAERRSLKEHSRSNTFNDISSFLSFAVPSPVWESHLETAPFTEEIMTKMDKERANNVKDISTHENTQKSEKDSFESFFNTTEDVHKPIQYTTSLKENSFDIDSLPVYRVGSNFPSSSLSCPLCLRNFEEGQLMKCLPCGHKFHLYCIDPWLLWVRKSCPEDALSIFTEKEEKVQPTEKESFESWEGIKDRFEDDSNMIFSSMMVVGQPIRERMTQIEFESYQDIPNWISPRGKRRSKRCPFFN